jgi:hypothetical protein
MTKYHLTAKGEPGKCTAKAGNCPYGSDVPHYATKELAREAFEITAEAEQLLDRNYLVSETYLKNVSETWRKNAENLEEGPGRELALRTSSIYSKALTMRQEYVTKLNASADSKVVEDNERWEQQLLNEERRIQGRINLGAARESIVSNVPAGGLDNFVQDKRTNTFGQIVGTSHGNTKVSVKWDNQFPHTLISREHLVSAEIEDARIGAPVRNAFGRSGILLDHLGDSQVLIELDNGKQETNYYLEARVDRGDATYLVENYSDYDDSEFDDIFDKSMANDIKLNNDNEDIPF